jgi:hypothetical protein
MADARRVLPVAPFLIKTVSSLIIQFDVLSRRQVQHGIGIRIVKEPGSFLPGSSTPMDG